ncbi:MAG: hypothetical protein F4Y00_03910 [Bacteroidetes bacterium SB0662_bin_6]|nr:hypothetical protein [Bacteroidetes bacterium SB0668_bin_1]MYE04099.1 hypothetical protein [Bacteroidetes bacterium SB0662_bin_6]
MRTPVCIIAALLALAAAPPAAGQMVTDTTFSWRGYRNVSTCRVRIYRSAPKAARPMTVVLDELAENRGRSTLDDAPHLAEMLSRSFPVRPDSAFWIFRWGSFSFPGATPGKKEIYLRATFRRSKNGALGSPSWRLIDRAAVSEYTDRAYR